MTIIQSHSLSVEEPVLRAPVVQRAGPRGRIWILLVWFEPLDSLCFVWENLTSRNWERCC